MQTVEQLRDRIESAEGLHQVVGTMKGLAAVNIRQYQRAEESLSEYAVAVQQGLQILLSTSADRLQLREDQPRSDQTVLAVVFGSDQGMVGQFNSQIMRHALDQLNAADVDRDQRWILAVGQRLAGRMRADGEQVVQDFPLPRSAKAIASDTQRLLASVQSLRDRGAARVRLMHHIPAGGASYEPHDRSVFPVSLDWLRELQETPWPGTCIPTFRIEPEQMLAELIEQYLFVSLFRAYAGSMAAENASRLASMQAAERNIEERLDGLRNTYHRLRQSQITSELLDVMAGFEAARE